MKANWAHILLILFIICFVILLLKPLDEESATVDETTYIGAGYAYLKWGNTRILGENPLLAQVAVGLPMFFENIYVPDQLKKLGAENRHNNTTLSWRNHLLNLTETFPKGDHWYRFLISEPHLFGQKLIYHPKNNAEAIILKSRSVSILFIICAALIIYLWVVQLTKNQLTGVIATFIWLYNPIVLGYGHLALTEAGISLFFILAAFWFRNALLQPSALRMIILGFFSAAAVCMKSIGLSIWGLYLIVFFHLMMIERSKRPVYFQTRFLIKSITFFILLVCGFWLGLLCIYFPNWAAPPPIDHVLQHKLEIPSWFITLRPVLIPGEFFKSLTLKALHSQYDHAAFLCGHWSNSGWWYYFPVAFFIKTPLPLLLFLIASLITLIRRRKQFDFDTWLPWYASAVYFCPWLFSSINIGMRHILPIYGLIAVGVAHQIHLSSRRLKVMALLVLMWMLLVVVQSHPYYLSYCNRFGGGPEQCYTCLLDSNYDWGQNTKRLKEWLVKNKVSSISIDYFGVQESLEWYGISHRKLTPGQRNLRGWVVISISQLMRPEWSWLRNTAQPVARIGLTLVIYKFPD
ncbi:phospholipid carrier-dependent glycosyltransferase [bacterium]|nr:phospholipid carrier-dependent glycosyltransferase [bacterium]